MAANLSRRTIDPDQVHAEWLHWWAQPNTVERQEALKLLRRQRRTIANRSGRA